MLTFNQFLSLYVIVNENKGICRIKADFFTKYPAESLTQAYESYKKDVNKYLTRKEKINQFEQFLIDSGHMAKNSNISESRYYYYDGIEYRFSSHSHPTGSMTSLNGALKVVDFF